MRMTSRPTFHDGGQIPVTRRNLRTKNMTFMLFTVYLKTFADFGAANRRTRKSRFMLN
jgi:hypothetical protein